MSSDPAPLCLPAPEISCWWNPAISAHSWLGEFTQSVPRTYSCCTICQSHIPFWGALNLAWTQSWVMDCEPADSVDGDVSCSVVCAVNTTWWALLSWSRSTGCSVTWSLKIVKEIGWRYRLYSIHSTTHGLGVLPIKWEFVLVPVICVKKKL